MEVALALALALVLAVIAVVYITRTINTVLQQTALVMERVLYLQVTEPMRANCGSGDDPFAITLLKGGTSSAPAAK